MFYTSDPQVALTAPTARRACARKKSTARLGADFYA